MFSNTYKKVRGLVGLVGIALLVSAMLPSPAFACTYCEDAPAFDCGYQAGYHYHGNDYAFFGIASGQGNYYCHTGSSCAVDINCWFGFIDFSALTRALAQNDPTEIEGLVPYYPLRADLSSGEMLILGCDDSTIVARVPGDRALLTRLAPFMVRSPGRPTNFADALIPTPPSAIVSTLSLR